ncbi:oxygenase MpaB family protein [Actinomadura sp. DC4]|uniref:oxygenase MpaB family protein n=1 Tax=Actinomadura sp. DC4 TaxID=3055069 RepID=UPI0025AF54DC|nr:oxygenase MpaB family protein [Actinomadura sp. DC4]MDN3357895.1 oxygenase MpaB family protein [Actinomadura sp. DC4]
MSLPPRRTLTRPLADRIDRYFDIEVRSRFFKRLEFAGPAGDPGWFGPDSAVWYVHSHLPTLSFGLACAAYLEGLDPSIHWMAADHSRLTARDSAGRPTGELDMEGAAVRFGHSLSFFIGTAYGSTETAERLARTVRAMHHTVKGTRPDGLAYDADDPGWLRWNYATVVWGLATAHERYHPRPLRGAALDGYYREFVRVGHALGGTDLPTTKAETLDCLRAYLPRLAVTPGKADRTGPNLRGTPTTLLTGRSMDWAIRDTLPEWAARMVMYRPPGPVRRRARRAALRLALSTPHAITGPIEEFRQAQARVAAGTTTAPVTPAYRPGSDPVRTRAEVEATT